MKILVTGSIAFDYLMTFPGYFKEQILPDRLEDISLSFLVDSMVRQRGGTAPNIAYTIALLGGRPAVMATAGEDFAEYRAWLEGVGVDTSLIRTVEGKFTASFFVNTDLSNAQIASFYTGAMAEAADLSLHDLPDGRPDLVVISPNDPGAMRRMARECKELGIRYLYDPSQQLARISHADIREGVDGAWALFVNTYEFDLLQKHTGLSADELRQRIPLIVVTGGDAGAQIYTEGKEFNIPIAPAARILDPTGVGDAFRGGFLTGLRLGLDWDTCGRMGSLAATYCLEERGTQNHRYTPAEFLTRYRSVFGENAALQQALAGLATA